MTKETILFLQILNEISDGKISVEATAPLNAIFEQGLEPLDFELALYSLEASTGREIAQAFYEGTIDDHLTKPIASFLRQYLSKPVARDPLFITKVFKKFRKSAQWEHEEASEPGSN